MQYEITDEAAVELSRSFYGAVARGIPVDTALTEARKGLATEFEDTLEWGTPVLFLEAPDGVLFNVAAAPVAAAGAPLGAAAAAGMFAAAPVAVPPEAPPVGPRPAVPPGPAAPEPEPVPTPAPVPTSDVEVPAPEPPEPAPPRPVPPPPPPRLPRVAILAGAGGAAVIGVVLVANIFGGGGAGESAKPSGSGGASVTLPASGTPSVTESATTTTSPHPWRHAPEQRARNPLPVLHGGQWQFQVVGDLPLRSGQQGTAARNQEWRSRALAEVVPGREVLRLHTAPERGRPDRRHPEDGHHWHGDAPDEWR